MEEGYERRYTGEFKKYKLNKYKGYSIPDYIGELLVSDSNKREGDLEFSTATINDIFRTAHKVTKDLYLGTTQTMSINTPESVILMAYSDKESKAHIHIFAKDGNHALGRMTIEKSIPKYWTL